jgi:hypothetical protein
VSVKNNPEEGDGLADVLEPTSLCACPERTSTFYFSGWSGSDFWRTFMPSSWQTRAAAKKLARGPYRGLDFATHHLVLAMPWGFFRVLDDKGHVTACAAAERPPI